MSGMITALDIAYEEEEHRSFLRFNALAIALTLCAIVGGFVAIALVVGLPALVQLLNLGAVAKWLLMVVEWPLLIMLVMAGLALMYRYAPDRDEAQWRWVSPGAIVATILWIIASVAFTVYVSNFGSYDKTYGSLGGAIIMLTWLYMSSFIVLFGAVINAQSERQTRKDTTGGKPEPMGRRRAYAADTVGESSDKKPSR
jgi:membrane protein